MILFYISSGWCETAEDSAGLFHLMCCMDDSLKLPRLQSKTKPQTLSPQFRDKREKLVGENLRKKQARQAG